MSVRPEEITAILKQQIEQFGAETTAVNVGTVVEAGDGIARVHGLSESEKQALAQRLQQQTGLQISLETEVDASLIGGLVVQIGDRLVDASARGRLNALRDQLVGAVG